MALMMFLVFASQAMGVWFTTPEATLINGMENGILINPSATYKRTRPAT
jgi:hypothetical protein